MEINLQGLHDSVEEAFNTFFSQSVDEAAFARLENKLSEIEGQFQVGAHSLLRISNWANLFPFQVDISRLSCFWDGIALFTGTSEYESTPSGKVVVTDRLSTFWYRSLIAFFFSFTAHWKSVTDSQDTWPKFHHLPDDDK